MKNSGLSAALCLVASFACVSDPVEQMSVRDKVLGDRSAAPRGEKIFNTTCMFCHGHEGQGGQGRPLKGQQLQPDQTFNVISKGRTRGGRRMPPYQKAFSETQRWELVAYLLTLSGK